MGVKVNVISRKFLKQWFNGSTFAVDLTNFTNNLAGLNMQKLKLIQTFEVSWQSTFYESTFNPSNVRWGVEIVGNTIEITRRDGGNFITDGFSVGDKVRLLNRNTASVNQDYLNGEITFINSENVIILFSSAPTVFNANIYAWWLNGITPLTSLIYNYGLIENSANFSTLSIVSNENQGWYSLAEIGEDIASVRQTNWVTMGGLGIPKSWENGSARVKFVSTNSSSYDNSQTFEIEHTFIVPYFKAGEIDDLENNVMPDYLQGLNSLKYVFDADFRTVISNPNTSKRTKVSDSLGSVGYFGESFNGFDINYKINSIVYTNATLNTADGILTGETTKVTVEIEKLVGNFAANDNVGVYFSYLPELLSEVKNTATNFETNFMYDNIFCLAGGLAQGGAGVLDDALAVFTTNILTITFITDLTVTQQLRLTDLSSYLLGFEVGDSTINSGNSDAGILRTVNKFDVAADIPDLMTFDVGIYPHTEDFALGVGSSDFLGWNEHGLALKGNFILDLTKSAFLKTFKIKLIAHNSTTNSFFELDNVDIQLGQMVANFGGNNYQILDMTSTRGYKLISGSEKNGVSIIYDPTTIPGNFPKYNFTFAQKIRWEDWIQNLDAASIFYDNSKPNNNLNYKTSNFGRLGYKIKMLFEFNVGGLSTLGVAADTIYRYFTPDFRIFDYDKDMNTTPSFSQVVETFDPTTLTDLGGALLVGTDTLMVITWTWVGGAILDIADYFGIHRIEESQGGSEIFEFSSYEANPITSNKFLPIVGFGNYLKLEIVSGKLVTSCLIDGTQLIAGVKYKLSGEIQSPPRPKSGGHTYPEGIGAMEIDNTFIIT